MSTKHKLFNQVTAAKQTSDLLILRISHDGALMANTVRQGDPHPRFTPSETRAISDSVAGWHPVQSYSAEDIICILINASEGQVARQPEDWYSKPWISKVTESSARSDKQLQLFLFKFFYALELNSKQRKKTRAAGNWSFWSMTICLHTTYLWN